MDEGLVVPDAGSVKLLGKTSQHAVYSYSWLAKLHDHEHQLSSYFCEKPAAGSFRSGRLRARRSAKTSPRNSS